jgi:hypothetical protein
MRYDALARSRLRRGVISSGKNGSWNSREQIGKVQAPRATAGSPSSAEWMRVPCGSQRTTRLSSFATIRKSAEYHDERAEMPVGGAVRNAHRLCHRCYRPQNCFVSWSAVYISRTAQCDHLEYLHSFATSTGQQLSDPGSSRLAVAQAAQRQFDPPAQVAPR